ncbi:MAG: bifunctional DNA-formamidopyrimidine glycosylase/DNA-(apurinic or apyrimidinic site) lyase [Hyphomicrobium sp.]
MPELPEVETVCRGLEPVLRGARVVRVEQRRADLRFPFPPRFAARLEGQTVEKLERRSKYILAQLSGGEVLVVHLGMTGRLSVSSGTHQFQADTLGSYVYGSGASPKHDHAVLHLESGASVIYNDPRRFGFMLLIAAKDVAAHPLFKALGVEPLSEDLSARYLAGRAVGRKLDTKAFLMDQRHVAGLGNIYVCEALFRAQLSPLAPASRLAFRNGAPNNRCEALVPVIRTVLQEAIAAGGSTLRDYRHTDGESGTFQDDFRVYGREGEPCMRAGCSGKVRRSVQSGRSTFWCPKCQK